MNSGYGIELILDIHDCKVEFNRKMLKKFFKKLCKQIGMKREDLHFWDYKDCPGKYKKAPTHLKGISAIQFIKTSNITIHTLDDLRSVYINIFSCKCFDRGKASSFSCKYFNGKLMRRLGVNRK